MFNITRAGRFFGIIAGLGLMIMTPAFSQEGNPDGDPLLTPVFARTNPGLVFVEGEAAVSTNFAGEPVSNYGCSGFRSLQLNRTTGQQGGAAFFAEYVFYVPSDGMYQFWYGGTPPGPQDDLLPSYSSPFSYILDNGERVNVYRENITVVEGYTPSYYWNRVNEIELTKGTHRIRVEVSEKRGFDGKYYFYLDSLVFLNPENFDFENIPSVFPQNTDDTSINSYFLTLNEYDAYISAHPDDKGIYLEVSLVYSLLGDYQNALKNLNKAMALDSSDPEPVILSAKNRLWKGDVKESLALYERALNIAPEDAALWSEAGKVAAWTANYYKAIDFFTRGLALFPEDLNLKVNLGLTYLWMSSSEEAERILDEALAQSLTDTDSLAELGKIEEANGYAEYAREVYTTAIESHPEYLEFYLLLQQSYLSSGMKEESDRIGSLVESTFVRSPELESELEIYVQKLRMRDDVINGYLEKLKEDPGNLMLRQELAQTYFWNGLKKEAIEQIRYVLTTYSYRAASEFSRRNADLIQLSVEVYSLLELLKGFSSYAQGVRQRLSSAASAMSKAASASAKEPEAPLLKQDYDNKAGEYAGAVDDLRDAVELFESWVTELDSYESLIEELSGKEVADEEAFSAAVSASGWAWNIEEDMRELESVMPFEPELASYMLAWLYRQDGRYQDAAAILFSEKGQPVSTDSGMHFLLYDNLMRFGDENARLGLYQSDAQMFLSEYPSAENIESRYLTLASMSLQESSGSGVYYEGLEEEADELVTILGEQLGMLSSSLRSNERFDRLVNRIIQGRLKRAAYYLQSDTYLIRYELGDYYLDEGENKKASEQFRYVIAVDPWNISATYKLGVVEQRYGNWYEAMKYYKKVYLQDSAYENTAYYYNQLARSHADKFGSSVQLVASPSEITLLGELRYQSELNSVFGINAGYKLDQERLYRAYGENSQASFQVHSIDAGLSFSFIDIGLKVTPWGGVNADSLYYSTDYVFSEESFVSFSEFFQTLSVYPVYGAKLSWDYNFLGLDLEWRYIIEPDTFYPDRNAVYKNDITAAADTWFDLDGSDILGPLTTRTYGRLQFMDDGNVKGQIMQDVNLGITLLSSPILKFFTGALFNYENSFDATVTDYYAPSNVIETKGILRAVLTAPSADWSQAFEGALWGSAGGYWSGAGSSDVASSFKAEGGAALTWVKNGTSYYLNLGTMGTFSGGENTYWEMSVLLGSNVAMPQLLAR